MKFTLALVALLFSSLSFAESCKKVSKCVELTTQLTGTKYLLGKNVFTGSEELEQEITLTKEDAEVVLSEVLFTFGFAKLPTDVAGVWRIFPAADIRYAALPQLEGSKDKSPEIPLGMDFYMLTYKGVAGSDLGEIARNLRPMLSRFGRIIDSGNMLMISDTAATLKKLLTVIKAQDVPLSKEQKAKRDARDTRLHQLKMIEFKKPDPHRP